MGAHLDALERSLAAAGTAKGASDAMVELARSLSRQLDAAEERGGLNAAGKPDTTTAPQLMRCLESLGLAPGKAPARRDAATAAPKSDKLASFRAEKFRVVG